jgi:hypothetical protein
MKKIILLLVVFASLKTFSQPQTFAITDSMPVTVNELKAGYTIKETEEDSKKDNQVKYKIYFYLTNTSSEAKIMYKKPGGFGHLGALSPVIALFKCTNATGARMTNKMASMELPVCKIEATVEDKECGTDKVSQNTRLVDIGFWIKPGETISRTYPIYVPLNERPAVSIIFYPEPANQTGGFINNNNSDVSQQSPQTTQEFVRIKNIASNMYLHNQNGPVACTDIDFQWWSAQWEIIPIKGTSYFNIRNRWKNNFLTTENNEMISDDGRPQSAWWRLDDMGNNTYIIKNGANNLKLILQNGKLGTSNAFGTPVYSQWTIEQ